jgi:hypothetical protein
MGLFSEKELPFLFTIIIALIGYHLNFLIENQLSSPIITYHFKKIEKKEQEGRRIKQLECRIRNISPNRSYDSLSIKIAFKTEDEGDNLIRNAGIIPYSPADIVPSMNTENTLDLMNEYFIPKFQPGTMYVLAMETDQEISPGIPKYPSIYLSSKGTVKIISAYNILAIIARNQVTINLLFIGLWIILGGIYFFKLKKNKKMENEL